ncbi:hypothetical protein ACXZ66_01960 [Corynebacterium sp. S7]
MPHQPEPESPQPAVVSDLYGLHVLGAENMNPDQAMELASNLFMLALKEGGELLS